MFVSNIFTCGVSMNSGSISELGGRGFLDTHEEVFYNQTNFRRGQGSYIKILLRGKILVRCVG